MKVYCLVPSGGEIEDIQMTLNFEKAVEWLMKKPGSRHFIEYIVSEDEITREWECVWHVSNTDSLVRSPLKNG